MLFFVKGAQFMYEVFEQLLRKKGVSSYKVAKEAGVTQTALSNWKSGRSTPTAKTLQKIADYFGVTIDYLMTGDNSSEQGLTARDNRDIAKDLDSIMEKLTSGENGPASYNGEEISPEAAELFKDELEIALKRLKLINKDKYTPKKYKK
jgi:transcriptional regulator with XRE-family HTH domain